MKRIKRRHLPLIGFLILAIGAGIASRLLYDGIQSNIHQLHHIEHTQRVALFSSCVRLNIVRATDNRGSLADYRFFTLTTSLLKRELTHPPQPTTASQKADTRSLIQNLESSAKAKTWIPITNCPAAVDNPVTFKIPRAVPFTKKLPKHSDLVAPGN